MLKLVCLATLLLFCCFKRMHAVTKYDRLAKRWAPMVRLAIGEQFRPSSVDFFLKHVKVLGGSAPPNLTPSNLPACHKGCFLKTIQGLKSPTDTSPAVLKGESPDKAPTYAVITEGKNTIDIDYWFFYPYNRGKDVCLGIYNKKERCTCPKVFGKCLCPKIPKGCIGKWKSFGNHVGDWENIKVVLRKNGNPIKIAFRAHGDDYFYDFNGKDFVRNKKALLFHCKHPIVYSAKGSHGARARAGRFVYQTLPTKSELADDTSDGEIWKTWKNLKTVMNRPNKSFTGEFTFFNFKGRWGNPKRGCGKFKIYEKISGECVLNSGPTPPIQKGN